MNTVQENQQKLSEKQFKDDKENKNINNHEDDWDLGKREVCNLEECESCQ